MDKKINVEGGTITKSEFIKEWTDVVNGLHGISWSIDWVVEVNEFSRKVIEECGKEFDRIYNHQKAKK